MFCVVHISFNLCSSASVLLRKQVPLIARVRTITTRHTSSNVFHHLSCLHPAIPATGGKPRSNLPEWAPWPSVRMSAANSGIPSAESLAGCVWFSVFRLLVEFGEKLRFPYITRIASSKALRLPARATLLFHSVISPTVLRYHG